MKSLLLLIQVLPTFSGWDGDVNTKASPSTNDKTRSTKSGSLGSISSNEQPLITAILGSWK